MENITGRSQRQVLFLRWQGIGPARTWRSDATGLRPYETEWDLGYFSTSTPGNKLLPKTATNCRWKWKRQQIVARNSIFGNKLLPETATLSQHLSKSPFLATICCNFVAWCGQALSNQKCVAQFNIILSPAVRLSACDSACRPLPLVCLPND